MQALRNPPAHGFDQLEAGEAIEMLALFSLLHRQLDRAGSQGREE